MLYREIIAVCSEIHTKHINTLCGQNVEFVNAKPGGIYSNRWALMGWADSRKSSTLVNVSSQNASCSHYAPVYRHDTFPADLRFRLFVSDVIACVSVGSVFGAFGTKLTAVRLLSSYVSVRTHVTTR
jgi:hypothetical protein